jgi:hypothetical protein
LFLCKDRDFDCRLCSRLRRLFPIQGKKHRTGTRFLISSILLIGLQTGFFAPTASGFSQNSVPVATDVDLLAYIQAHVSNGPIDPLDPSIPKYDRLAHFGAWMHQDSKKSCHDTRENVLARDADSSVPVEFKPPSECVITGGLWHEPYTGVDVTSAANVQIDHVVPLRNAYYSGAWAWRGALRCNYANFLANDFHLLAVSGHENMKKSDHGPENYMPPDRAFHCDYVGHWLRIKTIWQLTVTKDELRAIQDVLTSESCSENVSHETSAWLASQRAIAATPITACVDFERNGGKPGQNPGHPNPQTPVQTPDIPTTAPTPAPTPAPMTERDPSQSPVQAPNVLPGTGGPQLTLPAFTRRAS